MKLIRFAMFGLLIILVAILSQLVKADDFQWIINCQQLDPGNRTEYWVGYSSVSDMPDSYFAYLGNGPGFYMDGVTAGTHDRQIEVLLPKDDSEVTIWLDPEHYEITINHDTVAPDCDQDSGAVAGLTTITTPVDKEGQFSWERWDGYHWGSISGVTTDSRIKDGVLVTELTLGLDNPDHNQNDYRAIPQS